MKIIQNIKHHDDNRCTFPFFKMRFTRGDILDIINMLLLYTNNMTCLCLNNNYNRCWFLPYQPFNWHPPLKDYGFTSFPMFVYLLLWNLKQLSQHLHTCPQGIQIQDFERARKHKPFESYLAFKILIGINMNLWSKSLLHKPEDANIFSSIHRYEI